jgi:hypothetical protein
MIPHHFSTINFAIENREAVPLATDLSADNPFKVRPVLNWIMFL